MKIIYLHQYFNSPAMAGGTRSYEMALRLIERGHEVHIITSLREELSIRNWKKSNEAGIHVHWFPVEYSNGMSYSRRILSFLRFAWAAIGKAQELDGDIVFATSTPLTIAIPAVVAAKKKNIPMIFEVRDLWPELPIAIGALRNPIAKKAALRLERWAYENSKAVIALSPGMKQGVIRGGYPADRVAVIPNGSDNRDFSDQSGAAALFRKKRKWLGERPLIVYAGTLGKINGVGYLVGLAGELKLLKSDVCILIVGQGGERDSILRAAREEGVLNLNLFIEEQMPKRDMPALFSAATIISSLFVDLPEMRSNSANKFFDGLAAGKPIFVNYGGWMHDLVVENSCGLSGWRKSLADVAKEINEKICDRTWLRDSSESAKRLAVAVFDRDKLANQFVDVIEAVAAGNAQSASIIAPGEYSRGG